MPENRTERRFTCSKCGAIVMEHDARLDESGERVLNCPECNATIYRKRIIVRPLPNHLMQMPEASFNKRPE